MKNRNIGKSPAEKPSVDVKPKPVPNEKVSPFISIEDRIQQHEVPARLPILPAIRTDEEVSDDEPHVEIGGKKASLPPVIAFREG